VPATSAVIGNATNLSGMITRASRCTPDAGNTKLATPALCIVERAIHPTPGMAATHFDPPAFCFGINNGGFDILIAVTLSGHSNGFLGPIIDLRLSHDNLLLFINQRSRDSQMVNVASELASLLSA
jgi:hypothetical protein